MNAQQTIHFERIAKAIDYIRENFKSQPNLDEVAAAVHLSPFHFHRIFQEWAGTSPKKFLQFISIEHAKKILIDKRATLADAAYETGLSGTGRLHDLFIKIEGMTPAEFKNGGENLEIKYSYTDSPFGDILIASTAKGICHMAFVESEQIGFKNLKDKFPNAFFEKKQDLIQQRALFIFQIDQSKLSEIKLHLKGTEFQLKVWDALLKIPSGNLCTYGSIAKMIGNPKASRAVGSAIGDNPVAFIIPCHRVIQSNGQLGNYMWGQSRKTAIIGWEGSKK
jgi:AraC family transcriptional regulator of adaptative response/methylated-DNA-[protein]-cysteine methyltransferase